MKRAFTLIELLVVIAIIAILAAILFPVFAQAKEAAKKAAQISNIKQTGTSAQIYLADSDDTFPQAMVARPGSNQWGVGLLHPVPADTLNDAVWSLPERRAMAACFWANSVQPYMKNYQLMTLPVGNKVGIAADIFTVGVTPAQMGVNMNGDFHTLNSSSVVNNSAAVAFWSVQKININGRGFSTPALNCPATGLPAPEPCLFNPGGYASPSASGFTSDFAYVWDFSNTVWDFGKRFIAGRADTSAKSMPIGTTFTPGFVSFAGKLLDPYAGVNPPVGTPATYWPCDSTFNGQTSGPGNYWCYFRPDRTE
jgi:prepilin-type N-terminal cleavage/methylation domain-containing protein